ncbi:MAG: carboxypeptidase regulatory-like domain-containing protein [Janthinobacterium lividum]
MSCFLGFSRPLRVVRGLPLALACLTATSSACFFPAAASAQAIAGTTVSGYVLDPDQAAIPGATVTLTPAQGEALTVKSGSDGAYSFRGVPAGTYAVTVSMPGFASFVRQGVRVGATPMTLNTPMAVQSQNQEINVTTETTTHVSVDADSNGSSVVIKDKDLEALSDDPDELSSQLSALAGPSAGPNGGQIYVDGFTGGQLPPKSSIREIRVNQNPFSAQFDKQGFGRVEVFTKPGTDSFHGNFSVQGNAKFLNTSNPFLGAANVQPDYHRIFFLGSLTGPLTKKSSYSIGGSHRTIQDNSIFAGQIVSNSATPGVLCLPGDASCSLNNYPEANRAVFHPQTRYDLTPRVDLALSDKNTLTIRYQLEHNDQQNAGLGSTGLNTIAYNTNTHENQIQISDTQILSPRVINETRLALVREISSQTPQSTAATVAVQGLFSGGGSSLGTQNSTEDRLELQNYTSVALAKHFLRAGMRLRIYREALLSNSGSNGTFTYSNAASYIANQPFQYRIVSVANPRISGNLTDVGIYAEDDYKLKPNLTLSYGIRYEAQSDIHSNADLAPRVAASYGIPRKTGNPTTVLRAGFGLFYDRFALGDVVNSYQQNGVNQTINIYKSPAIGCSPQNLAACGTGAAVSNTTYQLGAGLRSAYTMQSQFGVDQQVGKRSTISLNYLNSIGVHQYLSRSIPTSATNFNYQYQSGGVFRQNQIIANFRTQLSTRFSLFGFYALSFANSNANGADSFPTDSLNPKTDYGRALFVQKNRVFLFGNWQAPFKLNFSPFMIVNSGSYYNITTGTDLNGDTITNDRAGFANGVSGNCKVATDFIAVGITGTNRVAPGYCTGPSNVTFNLRAVKVFGFGERTKRGDQGAPGGGAPPPGGGGGRGGGGGGPRGGGGGFGGGVNSGKKYTLNVGAQIQNLFNYVPYATPNGTLSSYNPDPSKNLFGRSLSLQGGGPGGSSSAVRTITLQATFNF